jgi:hypothetical protein
MSPKMAMIYFSPCGATSKGSSSAADKVSFAALFDLSI